MKIYFYNESGKPDFEELVGPLEVREDGEFSYLLDSNGKEYRFTKDGHFDTWTSAEARQRQTTAR